MPNIEYCNIDDPEIAELVSTIRKRRSSGKLLNLDRMLLHSPPFARGWNAMFAAIRNQLQVPRHINELVICAVARLNNADYEWIQHDNGGPIASSGLRLRPRDLAKIGSLYLNGGRWRERTIVSEAWTQQSTSPHVTVDAKYRYGYQWWIGASQVGGRTINWAAAVGNGGQRVFVFPSLELLVVCTAGDYYNVEKQDIFNTLADRYVLPAVRDLN